MIIGKNDKEVLLSLSLALNVVENLYCQYQRGGRDERHSERGL